VKSDEEIFCVDHLFEGAVNLLQQVVEIGGFVQRVNDVGKHHALGFHTFELGDVLIAEQNALNIRILKAVYCNNVEPAPLAGFGAKAATAGHGSVVVCHESCKLLTDGLNFRRWMEPAKRFAN